jgi:hypothetical protein
MTKLTNSFELFDVLNCRRAENLPRLGREVEALGKIYMYVTKLYFCLEEVKLHKAT